MEKLCKNFFCFKLNNGGCFIFLQHTPRAKIIMGMRIFISMYYHFFTPVV